MERIKEWVWCMHCERVFQVELGRSPKILSVEEQEREQDYGESCFDFAADFERQFGMVGPDKETFARCPYHECDGSLLDFHWWRTVRLEWHPEYPEEPYRDWTYPLYAEQENSSNKTPQ
jgi:hypothetical protein